MKLERISTSRPITVRREAPGWWEAYCSACDYLGSVAVLQASTDTCQQAIDEADQHAKQHHSVTSRTLA